MSSNAKSIVTDNSSNNSALKFKRISLIVKLIVDINNKTEITILTYLPGYNQYL